MSNQKNNLLLAFLAEYVNGKKDFNLAEIEGGIHMYKISSSYASPVDNVEVVSMNSKTPLVESYENENDFANHEVYEVESKSETSDTADVVIEDNFSKVDKKWPQDFVNQITDFALEKITEKKSLTKPEMVAAFDKKFLSQIPDSDKIKIGKSQPKYVSKLHKNIYNKLILSKKAEFNNGIYTLVKQYSA